MIIKEDRGTDGLHSKPRLHQLSADDASRAVIPTVETVAGDKGEPDDTETQGELNERFNHWTHAPTQPFWRMIPDSDFDASQSADRSWG